MPHVAIRVAGLSLALLPLLTTSRMSAQTPYDVTQDPYPCLPDDDVDDTANFYLKLLTINPAPGSTIYFPKGVYDFAPIPNSPASEFNLTLPSFLPQLTYLGDSSQPSRLRFHDREKRGLLIEQCTGVTLKNLTVEFLDRPFTQGTLTGKDPQGRWIEMLIAPGYRFPLMTDDKFLFQYASAVSVLDPDDRRIRKGTDQFYLFGVAVPFEALTHGRVRVNFNNSANLDALQIGDLVTAKAIVCHSIFVNRSTATTFQNVTIRRMPCFAVFDENCTNSTYLGCTVDVQGDELLSSAADGIHVLNHRGTLTITGCSLDRTGDDAITSHTRAFTVRAIYGGGSRLDLGVSGPTDILVGDVFEIFDPSNYSTRSITPAVAAIQQPPTWNASNEEWVYQVSFAAATVAVIGDRAMDLTLQEGGTNIAGNRIRNHRARGMLLNVSNLTVSDNDISGSTMSAIALGPEFYWDFTGFSRNVEIDHNGISDVGAVTWSPQQSGAISVQVGADSTVGSPPVSTIVRQNKNVSIHHNVIKQVGGAAVLMTNVANPAPPSSYGVFENEIWSNQWNPASGPLEGMTQPATAIHLDNCANVTVHDNRIEDTPGSPPAPPWPGTPAAGAFGSYNSNGVSFTSNRRVFHASFEADGHDGFQNVEANYWYNVHENQWNDTEDGVFVDFHLFGLFGLHPIWPFYIDRQTTQCSYNRGTMEVTIADPASIEFDLGSNALGGAQVWTLYVEVVSQASGAVVSSTTYQNTAQHLTATAPVPHWTRKQISLLPLALPAGQYKVRFRRSSTYADGSPYIYVDDLVIWRNMLADHFGPP